MKAQEIINMITPKAEATKGSKKIDNMLTWINSQEDAFQDKATEIFSSNTYMYDDSDISLSDAAEIADIVKKNSNAEYFIDGDIMWLSPDTQALASKLQTLARGWGLQVPRF